MFVPIAEEGLGSSDIALKTAQEYLSNFKHTNIDTLHLGCTHYPLLKAVIQKVIGNSVEIIDSAVPTAQELEKILSENNLRKEGGVGKYQFFVTDAPERVGEIAELFLDQADYLLKFDKIDHLTIDKGEV